MRPRLELPNADNLVYPTYLVMKMLKEKTKLFKQINKILTIMQNNLLKTQNLLKSPCVFNSKHKPVLFTRKSCRLQQTADRLMLHKIPV